MKTDLEKILEKMTINEKTALKNKLETQIEAFFQKEADKNSIILVEEVKNLLDGVGEGFVEGDYYANSRYYSRIHGVKNIRKAGDDGIWVKVYSRVGYLLPDEIDVDGKLYKILFTQSKNYKEKLNY